MSMTVASLHDLREALIKEYGEQEPLVEIKLSTETYHRLIIDFFTKRAMFYNAVVSLNDISDFSLLGIKITCDRGES